MQKRFTEEQIIGILREAEVDGAVIREVCRKHNITEQTRRAGKQEVAWHTCPPLGGRAHA